MTILVYVNKNSEIINKICGRELEDSKRRLTELLSFFGRL